MPVRVERGIGGLAAATRAAGVRERVMAWTLGREKLLILGDYGKLKRGEG